MSENDEKMNCCGPEDSDSSAKEHDTKSEKHRKPAEVIEDFKEKIDVLKNDLLDCICTVIPKDTVKHLSNSKKEFLLAIRSIIDAELENIDKVKKHTEEKDNK